MLQEFLDGLGSHAGRFVELGKRDIWSAPQARDARPHARYFVVDLAAVGAADPTVVGALL